MATENQDVKTADASSASADSTANRGMDGTEDSSASRESSQQDVSNQSLSEYLKKNVASVADADLTVEGSEEETKKEGLEEEQEGADAENKEEGTEKAEEESKEKEAKDSEKEKDEKEGDEEKGEEEETKVDPSKPVPYERFKEVNDKFRSAEQDLRNVQPVVEHFQRLQSFCQTNGITPEQFTKAMEIQALLNTDPEKALAQLTPIVESLQGYVGNKLPDDLQQKVDSGKLELDDAKEIAKLRAQTQFGEKRSQHSQRIQQQREQQALQAQMADSLASWETGKQKLDPDYVQGSSKWKMVKNTYLAMLNEVDATGNYKNPVRTPSDVTALMDKAYEEINGVFKGVVGRKPTTRKSLSSNGSSITSTKTTRVEDAKTMKEAIELQLAQNGRR